MPSHVSHLLFAEDCANESGMSSLAERPNRSYLTLGAQGPDFFYHNQRRKPSGLTYGSLMHRRGYGTTVSHMARWSWEQQLPLESWAGAWVVGFASHAILDRYTHPFINYFSGWVQPGDPHTERYRSMHPFLERLIDVALLRSIRDSHPNSLSFADQADCGEQPPEKWLEMMQTALPATYVAADSDELLRERLVSAYLDTAGYYRFTNIVDEKYLREGLSREERGEIGSRWLSIVHPSSVPEDVDVLNESHVQWSHPCDETQVYTDSFLDRYETALTQAVEMAGVIADAWNNSHAPTEERRLQIEAAVGNWNLSDGRETERPCRKTNAGPLPLRELQARIRQSITEGGDGSL